MTRSIKIFEASVDPDPDPYPFRLRFIRVPADVDLDEGEGVVEAPEPIIEDHDFVALGDPGSAGLAFTAASTVHYNDRGEQMVDLNGILRVFKRAMPPDDYKRLADLLDRQDLKIHMDQLVEIYEWLQEQYTGRPTREQRRSSHTARTNGHSSTGPHSSMVAI